MPSTTKPPLYCVFSRCCISRIRAFVGVPVPRTGLWPGGGCVPPPPALQHPPEAGRAPVPPKLVTAVNVEPPLVVVAHHGVSLVSTCTKLEGPVYRMIPGTRRFCATIASVSGALLVVKSAARPNECIEPADQWLLFGQRMTTGNVHRTTYGIMDSLEEVE